MTKDPHLVEHYQPLSMSELERADAIFDTKCWSCGDSSWTVHVTNDQPTISFHSVTNRPPDEIGRFPLHTPYITATCDMCGTIWTISASKIQEKARGNGNGE